VSAKKVTPGKCDKDRPETVAEYYCAEMIVMISIVFCKGKKEMWT